MYFFPPEGSTSDISASANQAIPIQIKNYHKSISENKEIVKLVSVLSTSINSSKKVWICVVLMFFIFLFLFHVPDYYQSIYQRFAHRLKRWMKNSRLNKIYLHLQELLCVNLGIIRRPSSDLEQNFSIFL